MPSFKRAVLIAALIAASGGSLCLAEQHDRVLTLTHPKVQWMLQFE